MTSELFPSKLLQITWYEAKQNVAHTHTHIYIYIYITALVVTISLCKFVANQMRYNLFTGKLSC